MTDDLKDAQRYQTDPTWLQRLKAAPSAPDGRHGRRSASQKAVLDACRELMQVGVFTPTMVEICELARRSIRTGYQIWGTTEALRLEAIRDPLTFATIVIRATGIQAPELVMSTQEMQRLVVSLVTGRALP